MNSGRAYRSLNVRKERLLTASSFGAGRSFDHKMILPSTLSAGLRRINSYFIASEAGLGSKTSKSLVEVVESAATADLDSIIVGAEVSRTSKTCLALIVDFDRPAAGCTVPSSS